MKAYDHKKIEKKWQKFWAAKKIFKTQDKSRKPKFYILDMFPYPSGEGLHVGHPKGYIGTDVYSRFKRMGGFNVLHPMGWDAFGLPAENYAIKNKIHPAVAVKKNIKRYKDQLSIIGLDYDWSREINTTDPKYYKWTQWIFLQLFKHGLAYQSNEPINWCPSCQTGLANEDLENGRCERCHSLVEKRPMRQWVLKITNYADRLLQDLAGLNWPESIKESQRNWIGRSEGAEIDFNLIFKKNPGDNSRRGSDGKPAHLTVFTTRADTLFGATYLVLAPEHPWVTLATDAKHDVLLNKTEVKNYVAQAAKRTEIERTDASKEKTGVELGGVKAINPGSGEEIPIFVADYVLADYGTGAIMAVPAHDGRDWEFAKKYNLPIKQVIENPKGETVLPYMDDGLVINSKKFPWADGLLSEDARLEIVDELEYRGEAREKVMYKLRDWVFSRQRYWGEPIPIIHCAKCGTVPVPESDLPVELPKVKSYAPSGTGESPLADITKWVNTKCPKCRGPAKRETNTMPQWAGSSWYYLAYVVRNQKTKSYNLKAGGLIDYWSPVDMYVGGTEHATRHLIYARFWHKFLQDIDVVNYSEPFQQLKNQGLIYGADGKKMSKRGGNVVNPDDIVKTYGADTFRLYEMFMGQFGQSANWDTKSIIGPRRFLERVWRLQFKIQNSPPKADQPLVGKLDSLVNRTIKKVSEDIDNFAFNTAISALMILVNELDKHETLAVSHYEALLLLLAPFAPHLTEELWVNLGHKKSIHQESWPPSDQKLIKNETIKLVVQINGKTRLTLELPADLPEDQVKQRVLSEQKIKDWLGNNEPKRIIYINNRLINFVI